MTQRTSLAVECIAIRLYFNGMTPKEVAVTLKLSCRTIYAIFARHGIPCRKTFQAKVINENLR